MDLAVAAEPAGVILTTDADAMPSDGWIEANLKAITGGADVVGGRIRGSTAWPWLSAQGGAARKLR